MSQKQAQLLNPINGNLNISGIITATSFVGSGEGLTGVASTDNIQTATEATFLSGVKITGVTTASGGVVGNVTGDATGLSGSPDIAVGSITASGNVSVAGTLTYQDVTNMDVLGIGTFQQGIQILANGINIVGGGLTVGGELTVAGVSTFSNDIFVGRPGTSEDQVFLYDNTFLRFGDSNDFYIMHDGTDAITKMREDSGRLQISANPLEFQINGVSIATITGAGITVGGGINATGISTFSGSTFFTGGLAEKYENAGTTLGIQTANPLSDGNVILFTGNESSGTLTINFTGVHSTLSNGETVSFTAIITPNGTGIITIAQVDGQAITIKWSGGSAPSAGASGQDIYTFQILKTGTGVSDYTIFGAATNYA